MKAALSPGWLWRVRQRSYNRRRMLHGDVRLWRIWRHHYVWSGYPCCQAGHRGNFFRGSVMAPQLSILRWNTNGLFSNNVSFHTIVRTIEEHWHCHTLTGDSLNFPGYHPFVLPSADGIRGLTTLVRAAIPFSRIENPISCGVESLAVEISVLDISEDNLSAYLLP